MEFYKSGLNYRYKLEKGIDTNSGVSYFIVR